MICGYCATGQHGRCTGLLRADFDFCRCADRQHAPLPADPQAQIEQNAARHINDWLDRQEAKR